MLPPELIEALRRARGKEDRDVEQAEPKAPPDREADRLGPYKLPADVAGYRETDPEGAYTCSGCAAYLPKDKKCLIVKGNIEPEDRCHAWAPGPPVEPAEPRKPVVDKGDVNFERGKEARCEICTRFTPPDQCDVLDRRVSPRGFCWLFDRQVVVGEERTPRGGGEQNQAVIPLGEAIGRVLTV